MEKALSYLPILMVEILDVYYVNLLSTAQLDKKGVEESCKNGFTTFKFNGTVVFSATRVENRWRMNWVPVIQGNYANAVSDQVWHNRFCHIGNTSLAKVAKAVDGMVLENDLPHHCDSCHRGQLKRKC